jgi:hypothetical protein
MGYPAAIAGLIGRRHLLAAGADRTRCGRCGYTVYPGLVPGNDRSQATSGRSLTPRTPALPARVALPSMVPTGCASADGIAAGYRPVKPGYGRARGPSEPVHARKR